MAGTTGGWRSTPTSRHPIARAAAAVLAVSILGACNGNGTTLPTEPPVQPRETTTTTIQPTTTTTPAPPTQPPMTIAVTPPPTSGPPSTPATTASPAPTTLPLSDEQAALDAVASAHTAWVGCIATIATCDVTGFGDFFAEPALSGVRGQVVDAQAAGYVVEHADLLTYEVLEVDLEAFVPYVLVCQRDGSLLVERRPGEPDRVIEGGYNEKIREAQLERTAEGWRVRGYATREEVPDQVGALCG